MFVRGGGWIRGKGRFRNGCESESFKCAPDRS